MEYLLYFPMDTGWELAIFMAMISHYLVMDYVKDAEPKRSKRSERQIFDEYGEVSNMILKAVSTKRFMMLSNFHQGAILQLIDNRYYGR